VHMQTTSPGHQSSAPAAITAVRCCLLLLTAARCWKRTASCELLNARKDREGPGKASGKRTSTSLTTLPVCSESPWHHSGVHRRTPRRCPSLRRCPRQRVHRIPIWRRRGFKPQEVEGLRQHSRNSPNYVLGSHISSGGVLSEWKSTQ
jgi:hypothetical protein